MSICFSCRRCLIVTFEPTLAIVDVARLQVTTSYVADDSTGAAPVGARSIRVLPPISRMAGSLGHNFYHARLLYCFEYLPPRKAAAAASSLILRD